MDERSTQLEDQRRLYAAAVAIKKLAPWEFMHEPDIFGIQNPEDGALGFVSVMGQMGEHFAVALYLGAEGLYGILDLAHQDVPPTVQQIFELPQLQASFEDRELLRKDEIQTIRELGLRFRGRGAWPQFRSFRPGFMPWILEPGEVRFLACALEQLAVLAPRCRDDLDSIAAPGPTQFLVRVPSGTGPTLSWRDEIMHIEIPEARRIPMRVDRASMSKVRQLPRSDTTLEIDLVTLPAPVQEKGKRPFFSYALLSVDCGTGMILLGNLMYVESTIEEMWGQVPQNLVDQMVRNGVVPAALQTRSRLVEGLLGPLAGDLDIALVPVDELPGLDDAMASMEEYFNRPR